MENKKITVLYFVGAGNSGSTILGMALGAHSSMVSIGELRHLGKFLAEDRNCTCGVRVRDCPFWSRINIKDIGNSTGKDDGFSILCKTKFSGTRQHIALYREISALAGKNIIVDSSKDTLIPAALKSGGEVDVIPLFLVRDARAYMDSYLRRGGKSALNGFARWTRMNLITVLNLLLSGLWSRALHVSFHDFSTSPKKTLARICSAAGVTYEPAMLEYYKKNFHNIGGTDGRFNLRPISPQEKWRETLPPRAWAVYWLCGGWALNFIFGANR